MVVMAVLLLARLACLVPVCLVVLFTCLVVWWQEVQGCVVTCVAAAWLACVIAEMLTCVLTL